MKFAAATIVHSIAPIDAGQTNLMLFQELVGDALAQEAKWVVRPHLLGAFAAGGVPNSAVHYEGSIEKSPNEFASFVRVLFTAISVNDRRSSRKVLLARSSGAFPWNNRSRIIVVIEIIMLYSFFRGKEMTTTKREAAPAASKEGIVLTKAAIRASEKLGISQKVLGNTIGLSEAVVSRMKRGEYTLARGKPFELAVLFVRLYRSLDAVVSGDQAAARAWIKNNNIALQGTPVDLIQKVSGLTHVIQYLDSKRAVV